MKPIKCIELSAYGSRAVLIGPDHPEYEELRARNDEAGAALDRWEFNDRSLRTLPQMLLVQLIGCP
jgi:hypothetical protein